MFLYVFIYFYILIVTVLKNIVKLAEIISSDLNVSAIKEEIDFIERKYIEINNSKETRIDKLLEDVPFIKEEFFKNIKRCNKYSNLQNI